VERHLLPPENKENKYLPKGWTKERVQRASAQMRVQTDADWFQWVMNYLGVTQRQSEADLIDPPPSTISHAQYIEHASRIQTLSEVAQLFHYLCSIKETSDADQKQ
jgi:hypothetical protein